MVSMKVGTIIATAAAVTGCAGALGGAAGAPASASSSGTATVSITLSPVAGEQLRGGITLAASDGGTSAQLSLAGLAPGARALVRLHAGNCAKLDRLGASFALLAIVTADPLGRANATARIVYRGQEAVPLSALTDGDHVIVVVLDRGVVACGPIPRFESRRIDVGRAIGAVAIGMEHAHVIKAYGRPRSTSSFTFPSGRPGESARYQRHGAPLVVVYSRGKVVWLETSSRYYRTSGGVGVGVPIDAAAKLPGFRPDLCEGGYSRRAGGTLTSFIPRGRLVDRVRIVKVEFFDC